MTANDPFAGLPEVPSFTVTSTTLTDGEGTPPAQMSGIFGVPGGEDVFPARVERRPRGHQELRRHGVRPRRPDPVGVLALGRRRHPGNGDRVARGRRRRHRLRPAGGGFPAPHRRRHDPLYRRGAAGRTRRAPLLLRGPRPRRREHRRPRRRHARIPRIQHRQPHPRPRRADRHRRDRRLSNA